MSSSEPESDADGQALADDTADFLEERLSRYKHPESFEIVSTRRAMIPAKSAACSCATSAQRG